MHLDTTVSIDRLGKFGGGGVKSSVEEIREIAQKLFAFAVVRFMSACHVYVWPHVQRCDTLQSLRAEYAYGYGLP